MDSCEQVRTDFLTNYPTYRAYCIETWKPDEVKKAKARKKYVRRAPTTRRVVRR